ncbi:MAG: SGNH/GDSL hydrolase family protein [Acutalibacteraceae bacterium]
MREEIERLQENIIPAMDQTVYGFYSFDDKKTGKKILFIGNSITKHRPKPEIAWENDCGMAASSLENDYVHQLMSKIRTIDSEARFAIQAAWEIEGNFENLNFEKISAAREYDADVIIMFFGANVKKEYKDRTDLKKTLSEACVELRNYVNPTNKAEVYWFGGFYIRPEIDAEKEKAANICGDKYTSLGDIPFRTETHGKFNHPSDLGMKEIAELMWEMIKNDF